MTASDINGETFVWFGSTVWPEATETSLSSQVVLGIDHRFMIQQLMYQSS